MKRRPIIPQHEFSFAADNFNLAGEVTADGQRIQAERERSARDRAESESAQVAWEDAALHLQRLKNHAKGKTLCKACSSLIPDGQEYCDEACRDSSHPYPPEKSMPGLAPGSRWTSEPMAMALATMQRGGVR